MNSPFRETRFEFDPEHLYFLSDDLRERLESRHPIYLVGGRGTGKTTLLHSLNWEQRLHNKSLQKQLDSKPFESKFIGVYLKVPEVLMHSLNHWLPGVEPDREAPVLALYMDLLWCGAAFNAVIELISSRKINVKPNDERAAVGALLADGACSFLNAHTPNGNKTLIEVKSAIDQARRHLEHMAFARSDLNDFLEAFPVLQTGEFGRSLADYLCELCNTASESAEKKWFLKICLDEGEVLQPFQQRVINTIVRLSRWPTFFIISYVREREDFSETLFPALTQERADRLVLPLDAISDVQFRTLAEGVASVRVRRALNDPRARFSLRRILGDLDLNRLLKESLEESASAFSKELLAEAEVLSGHPFFTRNNDPGKEKRGKAAPLICEAYLIRELRLKLPDPDMPQWQRRAQDSAEIRKKQVAAFLSIFGELKTRPRYAFAEMVFQISDFSIRDFLFQLDELFREAQLDLRSFLDTELSIRQQDKAIRAASSEKCHSIPTWVKGPPPTVEKYLFVFAELTAVLQRSDPSCRHLNSTERGIFSLSKAQLADQRVAPHLQIIKDGIEGGFLRLCRDNSDAFRFRVHSSLAPAFGFSYRGAYYDFQISLDDLNEISRATSGAIKQVARKIALRNNNSEDAEDLFNWIADND